ncbi:E3 ubiquitin/ISG15 ligase TRIM25 [Pangasianodon hypophthalmus]|uniref:E3 ubiquitin/ISG15 ligase TRIM25 n=1 Tax=Pangasianodon hypophthalmus TaxID=310915 RepID=UPI000F008C01|nr:E3 ubiquitin/ISG15 ligase TRIM25 [Pangasianodon hypophthalmus]
MSTLNDDKCEMAEVARKNQDPFSCPICLDPLDNPVTIPCGHNYCMACIEDYWNEDKQLESYSCPECRETFTPRPALNKNTMFAEVVEQFKKVRLQDASPCNRGPANVECSICTERKRQAVKFCPDCVESYCEAHTVRHEKANCGEKHIVVVISREPRMDICLRHNVPLEIYCRTDRQLICSLCFAESHRDHDAVSVAPISAERRDHKSSRMDTQHGNRHTSHKHGRRKHKRNRHGNGHGSRHRSSSRKTLHLKNSHEVSHECHGSNMIRHGHVVGDGHMKSKHRSRHGSWHMSSRHERNQH